MVEDFADLLRETRSAGAKVALTFRESTDVVRAAWRDHRTPTSQTPLGPGKPPLRERMRLVWDDITFAARSLRARPGYATVSILTLALGIGASTIVFSVIDKVIIQPLPYPDAEQLVYLFAHDRDRESFSRFPVTTGDYHDWVESSSSFESVTAIRQTRAVLTGGSHPERVRLSEVTDETFQTLGTRPHLGSLLDATSGPRDLLITHGTWQQLFAGAADIVGTDVSLNGEVHTVVGVTTPGFRHPWGRVAMWRPLRFNSEEATDRAARSLFVLARLRPGVSQEQAYDEMAGVVDALSAQYPETNEKWGVHILPIKDLYLEDSRTMYGILAAAVGLVLLIACVNLASLVLARGSSRQTEMSVRMALGAGRLRVVRLLLAEGTLVASAGAILGLAIATWGLSLLLPLAPRWPLILHETTIEARSFAFAFFVAAVALQIFSVLPAIRLSRPHLGFALRGTNRSSSASSSDLRFRRSLVVGQMALALVLMIGAGLLVRSVYNIISSDAGFDYNGVVSARVMMSGEDTGADVYFSQLLERAQSLPGVTSAGLADAAPMDGTGDWVRVFVDGERMQAERALGAEYRRVSPEYFDTLKIDSVKGRLLSKADERDPVALVNQQFISKFLNGREPMGLALETAPSMGGDTDVRKQWTVVGVVETVQEWGPASFATPIIYVPYGADPIGTMSLVLRTDASAEALVEPVRAIVKEIGDSPVDGVRALTTYLEASYETQRFMLALIGAFAVLAGVLSAIGLYGVMAYHVAQRQREIGVRIALGAARRGVANMVLKQAAAMAAIAVVVGVGAAVPLARAMSTLNFGRLLVDMHWFDPLAFALVPAIVIVTALLATWLPACRAARVDPVEALRAEA